MKSIELQFDERFMLKFLLHDSKVIFKYLLLS